MTHAQSSGSGLTSHRVGIDSDFFEGRLTRLQKLAEFLRLHAQIGNQVLSGGRVFGRVFAFQSENFVFLLPQVKGRVPAAESGLDAVAEAGGEILQTSTQGRLRRLIGSLSESLLKGLLRVFLSGEDGVFKKEDAQRSVARLGCRRRGRAGDRLAGNRLESLRPLRGGSALRREGIT